MTDADILGWRYTVKASVAEIYNEVVYDLLSERDVSMSIKLHKPLKDAQTKRKSAATIRNSNSSRSHVVYANNALCLGCPSTKSPEGGFIRRKSGIWWEF
jgi:hypothetical protein